MEGIPPQGFVSCNLHLCKMWNLESARIVTDRATDAEHE